MIRRSAGAMAVLAALSVLLAGGACSGDATDDEAIEDRLTACELIARTDVARALGGDVFDPDSAEDAASDALAGRSGCAWSRRDGEAAALVELVRTEDMSAAVRRTGFSATARFDAARSRTPDAAAADVGVDAFWSAEASSLHVLVGRSYVVIEVAMRSSERARAAAVELARPAVARLRR